MKNEQAIEYQISRKLFKTILEDRSGTEKSENPYVYAMRIINEQFGLRGTVKHLVIVD